MDPGAGGVPCYAQEEGKDNEKLATVRKVVIKCVHVEYFKHVKETTQFVVCKVVEKKKEWKPENCPAELSLMMAAFSSCAVQYGSQSAQRAVEHLKCGQDA